MELSRRTKLIWSVIITIAVAMFWIIFYLVEGYVPVVTEIKMTNNWMISLPLKISRWWDILFAPVWSTTLVLLFIFKKSSMINTEQDVNSSINTEHTVTGGLCFGLIAGLCAMLGRPGGLIFGLIFVLVIGLLIEMRAGLVGRLFYFYWILFGLFAGLGFGLVVGLFYGLLTGLFYALVVGLFYGILSTDHSGKKKKRQLVSGK